MRTCTRCGESKEETPENWPKRGGRCNQCCREISKDWQKNNPKERSIIRNRWRKNHPEEMKEREKRWRANKKKNNWVGHLITSTKCNARTRKQLHELTRSDVEELFSQQDGRCFYTGVKLVIDPRPHHPLY